MNEAGVITALRAFWIQNNSLVAATHVWDEEDGPVSGPWTRTSIVSAGSEGIAVGRTREENRGVVTIQVFHDRALGPGSAERLASQVAACWRSCRPPRIFLSAPSIAGLPREGAFNRQLVTLGWRADLRPAQMGI